MNQNISNELEYSKIEDNTEFPIILMISIILVLFVITITRIYFLDRSQVYDHISRLQAKYAAESGIIIFAQYLQNFFSELVSTPQKPDEILSIMQNQKKFFDWQECGFKNNSRFKITSIRKLPIVDDIKTPFIDESMLYEITCIGECGKYSYISVGLLSILSLFRHYGVVNSLNEYYFGKPLQKWISFNGSFENFIQRNKEIFENGYFSINGICHNPEWIIKLYGIGLPDPFAPSFDGKNLSANYSPLFKVGLKSPCNGPLYSRTPIIVDKHEFGGPIKTSSYFYARDKKNAIIKRDSIFVQLNSSTRLQNALGKVEKENISEWFSDRDSVGIGKLKHYWKPNFNKLRIYAKENGVYISEEGIGYARGKKIETKYFPQKTYMVSEPYTTPLSTIPEQDVEEGTVITLASSKKFQNYNNMSKENLFGCNLVFSENSLFIRGDIEDNVVIITPRRIYITGSINKNSKNKVFLIAGLGVALSTHDLENAINSNKEDKNFIKSALDWHINAFVYKVGAGIYSSKISTFQNDPEKADRKLLEFDLMVSIKGATVEGNINRWLKALGEDNVKVFWDIEELEKLAFLPISVNLIQLNTSAK